MKRYRTDLSNKVKEFEVVKETTLSITFLDAKGNKKNEVKEHKDWRWHETELDALQFLENRARNLHFDLKNRVSELDDSLSIIYDKIIELSLN